MSEMTVATGVPEVMIGTPAPAKEQVPVTFSGKWGDFEKDMAAIAQEKGQPAQSDPGPTAATPPTPTVQAPPQTPVAPAQAQVPAPEVPEKFRAPDGKLDQDKLMKSYFEAEKGLKRLQNQANGQTPVSAPIAAPVPLQAQTQAFQAPLSPFEIQVAQDYINEAAALGYAMDQRQAIAQARVQVRMMDAKHKADVAATFSEVEGFRNTLQEQARKAELENLAKSNPWVLTPQGQTELIKIREEQPWLNNSPEPWKAATMYLLGQRSLVGSVGQVPNPMATQQSPQMPAIAAQQNPAALQLNSPAEVMAHVRTLTAAQEAEFWQKAGLPWKPVPKQYNGI